MFYVRRNGKHHDLEEKKDHNQISEDLRVAILKGDVAVVVNILNQGEHFSMTYNKP